jgi:hypothetical protein
MIVRRKIDKDGRAVCPGSVRLLLRFHVAGNARSHFSLKLT